MDHDSAYSIPEDSEPDLFFFALNYRTASTKYADYWYKELESYVNKKIKEASCQE